MNLTTSVHIARGPYKIGYQDRILMLGSCFSDEVSLRLSQRFFRVTANPLGTLYNPLSIAQAIVSTDAVELVERDGLWHSFRHHGSFSSPDYQDTMERCIRSMKSLQDALADASVVVITFGSAYVYELVDPAYPNMTGQIVANCHKFPSDSFVRRRLTVDEIVRAWLPIVDQNADKHFIFTVSPVRHLKDGLHENQISKGILLQAVDEICVSRSDRAVYFPSYEILLDELRDYRYYADDMLHPSGLAVDYVFERFVETWMDDTTQAEMMNLYQYWQDSHHVLLHPNSPQSQAFTRRLDQRRTELKLRYPWLE